MFTYKQSISVSFLTRSEELQLTMEEVWCVCVASAQESNPALASIVQ